MATHALQLLLLIASAPHLTAGAVRRRVCPPLCLCVWQEHNCENAGLRAVPAGGNWSYVTTLSLGGNAIAALPRDAFAPYASLSTLDLDDNALTTLDFRVFARTKRLGELHAARNQIATLVPAAKIKQLAVLEALDLSFNRLSALDPHVFDAARSLLYLFLDGNPLHLPSNGPLLVHSTVAILSLNGVDGSALSPLTFIALPNLNTLTLNGSNVRDISGAFAAAPSLYSVGLQDNAITELPADAFMLGIRLGVLNLNGNPLEEIEPAALSVLGNRTAFCIEDTTIACNCGYSDVWKWSKKHGVHLNSTCTDALPCNFTK